MTHLPNLGQSLLALPCQHVLTQFVEPPVYHIKVEVFCQVTFLRTQQASLLGCSPYHHFCAKHQAGKLCTPFFKVCYCDSTWEINPRSADCKVDALTTKLLHQINQFHKSALLLLKNVCKVCGISSSDPLSKAFWYLDAF